MRGKPGSSITIQLRRGNQPPIAQAGNDQSRYVGDIATLDGSASTDSDALSYRWRLAEKPVTSLAQLNQPSAIRPEFSVDRYGHYRTELIVNDGFADSNPDTVSIDTDNSAPVAMAGPDQSAFVGGTVHLDGGASQDVDGNALNYRWSLAEKPAASSAVLIDDQLQQCRLIIDKPGHYVAQLIVNDGSLDSAPDRVAIDTQNTRPVADAGPDQSGKTVGVAVQLDGSQSADVDGDVLSYRWSLLHQPPTGSAAIEPADQAQATLIPDKTGDYISQLIVNDGQADSDPATARISVALNTPVNNQPVITTSPPLTATEGQPYRYNATAEDADNDTLTYSLTTYPSGMILNAQTGQINWTPATGQAGSQAVTLTVNDGKGGSDSQSYTITVSDAPSGLINVPNLNNLSRAAAETALINAQLNLGTPTFIHNPASPGSVIAQSPAAGVAVSVGTPVTLTLSLGPDQGLPPDPVVIAPKNDATVATTLSASTEFLYSGPNPIQTGVAPGTIEAKRAAVIRGKVLDKQNNPLSGVIVSINHHPEYGQTLSRADGEFDLAVNGGGPLTVNYAKTGYLPVQRQVQAPWQDYVLADDIVMLALDAQVTQIDLNAAAMQSAQGSVMTDADGARQATLLFPAGVQATLTLPDGSEQPLTTLHVRATEYTVGENGPKAMPGPLPPTSGYTYAVELSADEAIAADAKTVRFDRPVPVYVDNFLNFPVGETVPAGWYDRDKSAWIPSNNGRVLKILAIAAGLAQIDGDGDGLADNATKLAAIGITPDEQTKLAGLYPAGHSLWRVPVTHFTPWDHNLPYGPPPGASPPPPAPPGNQKPPPGCDSDKELGCSINPQARTVGEALPVTGTPFTLHYQSRQTPGYQPESRLDIPVAEADVPASLLGIDLTVSVAGQRFTRSFPAVANQTYHYSWDGRDGYGRTVSGASTATVTISYRYNLVYYAARSDLMQSFALASAGGGEIGRRGTFAMAITRSWHRQLTAKRTTEALGGWHLDIHHRYDAGHGRLELGNGEYHRAGDVGRVITTVAGTGLEGTPVDGAPAVQSELRFPRGVAIGPDGSLYIADQGNHQVYRVGADSLIAAVAGTGEAGYAGDGGPALQAKLDKPHRIAFGPDGSLYITESGTHHVRKVDTDGRISTLAGTGQLGLAGDGGPAVQAKLFSPDGIAVAPDGSVYIAESHNNRVRRIGTDGIISSVVYGTGENLFRGPKDVAVGPDGSLYIAEYYPNKIQRVGVDGVRVTIAGTDVQGYSGDGGPATQAAFYWPHGVTVGPDGSVYIVDTYNQVIRRVGTDGIITTVAGVKTNANGGYSGDGGPARRAQFAYPEDIVIGPDGSLIIANSRNIRRVAPPLPGYNSGDILIPSPDGSEVYHFDTQGRHLRTLNALTRSELYRFSYDSAGRLSAITDVNNDITHIERDVVGNPTAIIAPDGQRTTLALDGNGYLADVTNPAGETHRMTYTAEGLLTTFSDPKNNANTFSYDALRRLSQDIDAGGGGWTLSASQRATGYTTTMVTGEGRSKQFAVDYLPTGERRHTNTAADGTGRTRLFNPGSYQETTTDPNGTITTRQESPDPRFGMQAPITTRTVTTPSGLTATLTRSRSAVLTDPKDPLSLSTLSETATINGKITHTTYNASAHTYTATSPTGRITTATSDAQGRPTKQSVPGINDLEVSYDNGGRLRTIRQGAGADVRSSIFDYYDSGANQGYLHTVTDALNRTVSYDYDLAGRVTQQTLPDGRVIGYDYDANGNLTALTPPGRPAHQFEHTAMNLTKDYTPPAIDTFDPATRYSYNLDKQLELITRPDGQTLDFIYDSAGRLSTLTTPHGDTGYHYDSAGRLQSLSAPGNVTLTYAYDGSLLTNTSLTGPVTGSVSRSYDNNFRTRTLSVNDADAITFSYDDDSLLTGAGELSLSRSPQNGLLTGTGLGQVNDSRSYNGFGEIENYQAKVGANPVAEWSYQRDKLGRITQQQETVQGNADSYDYGYDLVGRLIEVKHNGQLHRATSLK